MLISKWSYLGIMIWCVISTLMIKEASGDTMVILNAVIFGSSAICFEIRTVGEQLKGR